jgi:hypothetical protein
LHMMNYELVRNSERRLSNQNLTPWCDVPARPDAAAGRAPAAGASERSSIRRHTLDTVRTVRMEGRSAVSRGANSKRPAASLTVYIVRHGETDWNQRGIIQGQSESTLSALGVSQVA